jgi:ribonuclease Z
MVLGEHQPGTRLVMVGDAGEINSLIPYCMDSDGLVIEGTYLEEEKEMARQFSHLTVGEAADLAVKANIKQLFITHVSRRYRDKDVEKEALKVFTNTHLVHDFDSFQIKREEKS